MINSNECFQTRLMFCFYPLGKRKRMRTTAKNTQKDVSRNEGVKLFSVPPSFSSANFVVTRSKKQTTTGIPSITRQRKTENGQGMCIFFGQRFFSLRVCNYFDKVKEN